MALFSFRHPAKMAFQNETGKTGETDEVAGTVDRFWSAVAISNGTAARKINEFALIC